MNTETLDFIRKHLLDDVQQLALYASRFPNIDMTFALRQIEGRQKAKNKIPIFVANENILYPAKLSIEQSSSELTAVYKSTLCQGECFVDLTGGFGIDCYFISKNFTQTTYIERNNELCEIARHNFKALDIENVSVFNLQSEEFLNAMQPVDFIFIDPARRNDVGNKVISLSDCEPNVAELSTLLLAKGNNVMIKLSPMLDITKAIQDLPATKHVHIISVDNECKEILLLMNAEPKQQLTITTINIFKNNTNQVFNFDQHEETAANAEYTSNLLQYLYEPNSSVMKSGAFKLIAQRFDLKKLEKNTHLYTSNEYSVDFPGRIFQIESISGSSKPEIKQLKTKVTKANIAVRNYPLTVAEFRKKTGISEGGDHYIFACKLVNKKNAIIICKKVS
ncbi:MAG: RsmD family RNA methyltransferase [Paludibacter sp.]|nr:RsmD family RNA methyltransferase [Paludibacter sp.]